MQIFFTIRFIVLLAQITALFLLIIISQLCGITPFRELLSKEHAKCGSKLREVDLRISGLNIHYAIINATPTTEGTSSIAEQLKRVVNYDSNSTSSSSADNLDVFEAGRLLKAMRSPFFWANNPQERDIDPLLNSTALRWNETADGAYLEIKDSNYMEPIAHRRGSAAPSIHYGGETEEMNMIGNVVGNESLLLPLKRFQIQSFSCIAISYADIWHIDWGIPYSQINAPIFIVFEIMFTVFSTGMVLVSGPTQSAFMNAIHKFIHIISCALSTVFTAHLISRIENAWTQVGLMHIVPQQWKASMFYLQFIMFVLTFIFIAEIFCWNFLFLRCELRRSFGEYDLVNAGIQENGEVYNSTVTAISLKDIRSVTTISATE